jgi:hypothetical protein
MLINIQVLGEPVLYGYGNHEVEKLPEAGEEITLPTFQRAPIRFYVDSVVPGDEKPCLVLRVNENIALQEVAERCGLYIRIP